jgi:hypothetical protein
MGILTSAAPDRKDALSGTAILAAKSLPIVLFCLALSRNESGERWQNQIKSQQQFS